MTPSPDEITAKLQEIESAIAGVQKALDGPALDAALVPLLEKRDQYRVQAQNVGIIGDHAHVEGGIHYHQPGQWVGIQTNIGNYHYHSTAPPGADPNDQVRDLHGLILNFLDEYSANFGGRQENLAALDAWLKKFDKPIGMLVAPAGQGKSALLANWVKNLKEKDRAIVVYHPISLRHGTNNREETLQSLTSQLEQFVDNPISDSTSLQSLFAQLLRISPQLDKPLVVVVDGLDELDSAPDEYLHFPGQVGKGIHLLVSVRGDSQRDKYDWRDRLNWESASIRYFGLEPLEKIELADLLRSSELQIESRALHSLIERVYHLSEGGDPLIASLLVRHLKDTYDTKSITLESLELLEELKPGIGSYIGGILRQLEKKEFRTEALFEVLCIARGALTRSDLKSLGVDLKSISPTQLSRLSGRLITVIPGGQLGHEQWRLAFSHPRIGSAYAQEYMPSDHRSKWVARFRAYGTIILERVLSGHIEEVPEYVLQHYSAHLFYDEPMSPEDLFSKRQV